MGSDSEANGTAPEAKLDEVSGGRVISGCVEDVRDSLETPEVIEEA